MPALTRIISGGQTGADQGGLEAATKLRVSTGGWMPHGFLTETGLRSEFARLYDMRERPESEYAPRTEANVRESDGTVIFGDVGSIGSRNTKEFCAKHGKPRYLIPWRSGGSIPAATGVEFLRWLEDHNIRILNVAGNREGVQPGIQRAVREFLIAALRPR
ncbi:MAG: hypothetical protein KGJ66_10550 [Alphaproteobacteria bacterium]|nr:hypothetical protein [Alphaproteobacteria bacterium]